MGGVPLDVLLGFPLSRSLHSIVSIAHTNRNQTYRSHLSFLPKYMNAQMRS